MSAAAVTLRQAKPDDAATAREILAAAAADLTARFGEGHWSHVRSVATLRKHALNGTLYLADAGLEPVGVLRLTEHKISFHRREWFARPNDPAGYLLDMSVHPSCQRQGIGRRAMDLVDRLARCARLSTVRLDAYAGPAGAGPFYRKCGYIQVHSATFRGVALEYFEKVLPPGLPDNAEGNSCRST
jgi:GNAT superfamily N-acetyltransferase